VVRACLPPVCPGFDSWIRNLAVKVLFQDIVGSRPFSEGFSLGSLVLFLPNYATSFLVSRKPEHVNVALNFQCSINFPCSRAWLTIWENDITFSKIPHAGNEIIIRISTAIRIKNNKIFGPYICAVFLPENTRSLYRVFCCFEK